MLTGAYTYVLTLCEEKNFSKAAKKLGISQPALSAAISRLEQALGTPLFDRTHTPVRLTQAGKEYLLLCKNQEKLESEFLKKISDLDSLNSGNLVIGGSSCFTSSYLPRATAEFIGRYPNIDVRIVDGSTSEIAALALEGEIDLFITPKGIGTEGLTTVELLTERVFLCLPPDRKLTDELARCVVPLDDVMNGTCRKKEYPCVDIQRFGKERFILLDTQQHIRQTADKFFKKHRFTPQKAVIVDQMMTSYSLTVSGVGASFMTESAIRLGNFKNNAQLFCFDKSISVRTLCAAYKKDGYLSKAAHEYISILCETINS